MILICHKVQISARQFDSAFGCISIIGDFNAEKTMCRSYQFLKFRCLTSSICYNDGPNLSLLPT